MLQVVLPVLVLLVAPPTFDVYVQRTAAIYQGWLNSKMLNKKPVFLIGIHVLYKEGYISDHLDTRKIKRIKTHVFVYFRSFLYLREGFFFLQ